MTNTPAPTTTELVSRAADLVPLLKKHAIWTEENRRLHDETIEALADAMCLHGIPEHIRCDNGPEPKDHAAR